MLLQITHYEWGWMKKNDVIIPIRTDIAPASE